MVISNLARDKLLKLQKDKNEKAIEISKRSNDEKGEGEEAASFGV